MKSLDVCGRITVLLRKMYKLFLVLIAAAWGFWGSEDEVETEKMWVTERGD